MRTARIRWRSVAAGVVAAVLSVAMIPSPEALAAAPRSGIERVSVNSNEQQAATGTAPRYLKTSAHGRFVAFESPSSSLVPNDTNGADDVFVRDRASGTTTRASVSSRERQGDEASTEAAISANGRFVVFTSGATNLVRGDSNDAVDVFIRDLRAGTTRRVSVGADGRQARGFSFLPTISAKGRFVAFQSTAANLVDDDTNGMEDVFVRDRFRHLTTRVSIPRAGGQFVGPSAEPVVSATGRYVAFISNPRNPDIFDVFLRDRRRERTRLVSVAGDGGPINGLTGQIAISGNGRYVAYPSDATNIVRQDTNGAWDLFVRDMNTGRTERVSVSSKGAQGNADSDQASLSYTGRYVAFASSASNLVRGDSNAARDAFIRDRRADVTRRISRGLQGRQANSDSGPDYAPEIAISSDGQHAAFVSIASNLVRRDTNDAPDVFAWTQR